MNDSDELKKKLIKSVKIVAKRAVLFSNIILLPVIIIIVLLAASVYFITVDDGTYDEDDWSSVPFAAAKSTSDSNISKDGAISTKYTAQETWDKIKENKGRVNLYLDDATELAKLMNAELVTQFLDTRSNPDEPIDWEKEIDPESKDVQGIIKLKRADADGNKSTMTYVDPETFQSYIEDYNKSGSEDAKQKVLSHFTLEQEDESDSDDSDSDIGIIKGNGTFTQYTDLTDAQIKAIANLCKQEQGSPKGAAAEASLMANRFELVGSRFGTGGAGLYNYVRKSGWFAHAASHMDNGSATKEYIDVVKGVLVNGKRTLPKYIDEHDCFTDISNATNKGQAISVSDRSQYKQYVTKMNNRYGAKYTFFCFPTETSDPFGYTSKKSRKKYGDAYYDFDTGNLINGTEDSSTDNSSLTDDDKKSESDSNSSGDLSNSESNSNSGGYYAKVATWKETTDTIKTNDPEVQSTYGITNGREEKVVSEQHTMDTAIINYQDFVKGYTMPFQYLWALLVIGEDKDFVMQLADLVYNSELEITVHDNLAVNTDIQVDTYTKNTRTDTNGQVTISYGQGSSVQNVTEKGNWTNEESNKYETTYKTVEKKNTLDITLTRANVWIVDYTQEYTYKKPTENTTKNENKLEDKNYGNTPDSTSNDDTYGHVNALLEEKKKVETEETYDFVEGRIDSIDTKVYHATVDRNRKTTNTVETTQYISSPGKTKEKTDKKAKEPNFVNILLKDECKKAKKNIIQVRSWLYEILESNDTTKNMIDLTKYLLYKVTGKDYGVTEYDFNVYEPDDFATVGNGAKSNLEGVPGQIADFFLEKGMTMESVAAILGNIQQECNFNPSNISSPDYYGGYHGLCQWGNYKGDPNGRFAQLEKLATKEGTDWTDVNTQLKFIWKELNSAGYLSVKNKLMSTNNVDEATKYFAQHYEKCINADGSIQDLDKRQKYAKEWLKQLQEKSTGGSSVDIDTSSFLATAKSCHDYLRENNYWYPSQANLNAGKYVSDGESVKHKFPTKGEDPSKRYMDCSGYVSWVLKEYGYNLSSPYNASGLLSNPLHLKEVPINSVKAGDILVRSSHTEIYCGNGKSYNCGSTSAIRSQTSNCNPSKFTKAFRVNK